MPASIVFDTVTVAPGRKTVWFTIEWDEAPNKGPICCMASPAPHEPAETKLVVEDFATCRHPNGSVFYAGMISNLGADATGARIMGVYFPELEGAWIV
jgi:hypothetical protein